MRALSSRSRVILVLLAAVAFGVLAAWAKGQNSDGVATISQIRSDVGNLSTPWLLVAFIAGIETTRPRWGAILGLTATLLALLGFYAFTSLVVDAGGHGLAGNFGRELFANRIFLASGVFSGPLFGALGSWWRNKPSLRAGILVGALMIGEPLVLAGIGVVIPATVVGRNAISLAVYGAELALGVVVLVVAATRPRAAVTGARVG